MVTNCLPKTILFNCSSLQKQCQHSCASSLWNIVRSSPPFHLGGAIDFVIKLKIKSKVHTNIKNNKIASSIVQTMRGKGSAGGRGPGAMKIETRPTDRPGQPTAKMKVSRAATGNDNFIIFKCAGK